MSGVKRYEHAGDYCGPRCGFEESADGDWVFASDYDALSQRCRELEHAATNDLVTRLLEQLDASNAENYHGAEFDVELGSEQMIAVVMLQRRGHPSAHDLRLRAEQERDQLRAEREALAQRCAELEQCMSEPLNKLVRERDNLRAQVEQLQATVDRLEPAYLAWQEKTDWVQRGISDGSLSAKYLGWHRADILKAEIERLQAPGPAAVGFLFEHTRNEE